MVAKNIQLTFFLIIFTIAAILGFLVLKPYINVLILAGTFAIIFYPLYDGAVGKKKTAFNKRVAAVLTIFFILAIVLLPLTIIGMQVVREGQSLYQTLQDANSNETSVLADIPESSNPHVARLQEQARAFLTKIADEPLQYIEQGTDWLGASAGPFFRSLAGTILGFFLWAFSLYYFFKDGDKIKQVLITASPLNDKYDNEIIQRMRRAVKSVIGGTLVVTLIQGVLVGVGFAFFGVPLPAIWGSVAVLTALIPTIGTGIVSFPAILFLFFTGDTTSALFLLIWSMGFVGMVDNFLRPILLEKGVQIHPLLILLSVLGGISFFGPIGFITGPLVMTLLSEFMSIYRQLVLGEGGEV
ncbi:MAG: AI-2E family transporter [Candidatus Paceibacterota bacterium]